MSTTNALRLGGAGVGSLRMSSTAAPSSSLMANNKMLHVVYRVGNMDRAINFYKQCFGMKVLRSRDIPEEKYTNAFLGYGPEQKGEHFSLELTYNYGVESYDIGDAFLGMGLTLPNLVDVETKVRNTGGVILKPTQQLTLGASLIPDEPATTEHILTRCVVKDLDGYTFELTEGIRRDPISKVILRVDDLDEAQKFYIEALGMKLHVRRANLPVETSMTSLLGYGSLEDSCALELKYLYASEDLKVGTGYAQIAVSTPDVYAAAAAVKALGGTVSREPGPVPGIGTKITAVRDPDNYKTVLVDEVDFEKEF